MSIGLSGGLGRAVEVQDPYIQAFYIQKGSFLLKADYKSGITIIGSSGLESTLGGCVFLSSVCSIGCFLVLLFFF